MSKKEEKRAILRTAVWIAVIGCLASVVIGFAASLIFGFAAAPIIGSGAIITAICCAFSSMYVKANVKKEDGEK